MSGTLPIQLSDDILNEINNFIHLGNKTQQLEIEISQTKISIDDFLNEITFLSNSNLNNSNCKICKNSIKNNQVIRTYKTCNHFFHKKCFDKLFKQKIKINNFVNETTIFCPDCEQY